MACIAGMYAGDSQTDEISNAQLGSHYIDQHHRTWDQDEQKYHINIRVEFELNHPNGLFRCDHKTPGAYWPMCTSLLHRNIPVNHCLYIKPPEKHTVTHRAYADSPHDTMRITLPLVQLAALVSVAHAWTLTATLVSKVAYKIVSCTGLLSG